MEDKLLEIQFAQYNFYLYRAATGILLAYYTNKVMVVF